LGGLITSSLLQNALYQQKAVASIVVKTGNTPSLVTTTTVHGLVSGNQVVFDSIAGMTEIEDKVVYVNVISTTQFELFTDAALTTAYDNSAFTPFVSGNIGLRYQSKFAQDKSQSQAWDGAAGGAEPNGAAGITSNY
jgi:hypothetical protein